MSGVQLNPTELGFQKSFDVIIMVVLGGLGSISGAALAAAILTVLLEALRTLEVSLFTLTAYTAAGVIVLTLLGAGLRAALGARNPAGAATSSERLRWKALVLGAGLLLAAWVGRLAVPAVFGYTVKLGDYRMILYALALVLMMIARPQGLFGVREVWERAAWEWAGVGGKRRGA
jgi:ABC-type branched-subunit amino acid transport system permease subunit